MPRRLPPDQPPEGNGSSQQPQNGSQYRVIDRRRPDRVWLPAYVIHDFGPRMGVHGLAVYVLLCHHASRDSRDCWPSLNLLAAEVGTSRSTVERAIRLLESLKLICREPRVDPWGQRSNLYILTDPDAPNEQSGVVDARTEPPVNRTGGRRPNEGGPPSIGRGAPFNRTAPNELDPGNQDPGNESAPPPVSAPEPNVEADALAKVWLELLVCPSAAIRAAAPGEITAEVAELLRRGYSAAALETSMRDRDRDRTEFPRVWRARVTSAPPARRRSPAIDLDRAREAERKSREEAFKERQAKLGVQTLAEVMRERKQRGQ